MSISQEKCEPCHEGTPPLSQEEAKDMSQEVPSWDLKENSIERAFKFDDFEEAMDFVNEVAHLAKREDHHPDIFISYNKVRLTLTTHKIGGLSRNDFILAAKIDEVV